MARSRSGTPWRSREYLNEIKPAGRPAAGRCRGPRPLPGDLRRDAFGLRQPALGPADEPQGAPPGFKVWAGAQADIERVTAIWRECLQRYGGPYLFGTTPTMADAMYAPVCTRFATYDVKLDPASAAYRDLILRWPPMLEWTQRGQGRAGGSRGTRRRVLGDGKLRSDTNRRKQCPSADAPRLPAWQPCLRQPARAQAAFPTKPMTLVVPFPAGGPSDVFGRHLAQGMAARSASRCWSRTRAARPGVTGVDFVAKAGSDATSWA